MALTPEDVVNKRFQPTKFREGYDQDEVDDFLDEIVVELRRLNQENDELRRKVSELQSGETGQSVVPAPVSADGSGDPSTASQEDVTVAADAESASVTEAPVDEEEADQAPATAAGTTVPAAKSEPVVTEPAPAAAATGAQPVTQPAATGAPEPGAAHGATATSAAGVLAMAQKLHDDYVAEGQTKREHIIQEAESEATGLVNDAQEKSRKTLAELEEKKSVLERKVEQLKGFERDYRARLKAYIEGQLRDLQNQGPIQDEATASH